MKRRQLLIAAPLALAGGLTLGNLAGADPTLVMPPDREARASLPESAQIRTNTNGKTYGSAVDAARPEDEPDLILVVATNGREGYVWKQELYLPEPKSPAEAARRGTPAARVITVYEEDGVTRVGQFIANGQ